MKLPLSNFTESETSLSRNRVSRHTVFVAGSWLYVLLYVALYLLFASGAPWLEVWEYARFALFNIFLTLPALAAGAIGLVYARRFSSALMDYRGWILVALAGLSFAIGSMTWGYYEFSNIVETPFPSWADAAYLTAQLFLIAGISVLLGVLPVAGRVRLMLDSAIAMTSIAALLWYLLVGRLWSQSETTLFAKLIGIAYPMSDVVILYGACVLYFSTRRHSSMRRSAAYLVAGVISLSFSDSCFTYLSLDSSYQTGMWIDVGWIIGWLLIANALRMQLVRSSHDFIDATQIFGVTQDNEYSPEVTATLWQLLGPYFAATLAIFAIAFYDYSVSGEIQISIFAWGTALLLLVALRQAFTISENLQLTQRFASLLQYARELNDVLEAEHVLRVTATYAQSLTGAHSAAAWITRDAINVPCFSTEKSNEDARTSDIEGIEAYVQTGAASCFALLRSLASAQVDNESSTRPVSNAFYMVQPLWHRGKEIGAVAVTRRSGGFSRAEHNVLEGITLEAGTAISNALSFRTAVEAADCDAVTGLLNHRAVHDLLRNEWENAQQTGLPLSIVMMDLNDFKFFNDTYGHPIGDLVLQTVARVLRESCQPGDALARYGGDEFILLLPNTNAENARRRAHHIREHMIQEGFHVAGRNEIVPVELSLGIATFPDDAHTRNELMAAADANLYRAKLDKEPIYTSSEVQRSTSELRTDESYGFLDALVTAVDNKDSYTRRHSEDVTDYALWLAEEIGLSPDSMRAIRIGGLLHDVGKIGVPDEILRKPGVLSIEEYEIVKRHPGIGALIVSGVPGMHFINEIVRSHHERWDGKGYPDGLSGENIPLLARIVAIADACSAMTTTRPYRRGLSWEVALAEVETQSGKQFDPVLAEAFVRAARRHLAADALKKSHDQAKSTELTVVNVRR